ncbi:hypothetical protein ACFX1X_022123 [Malus domestica]
MWSRQPAGGQREEAQEPQNFTWVGEFGSRIRTFAHLRLFRWVERSGLFKHDREKRIFGGGVWEKGVARVRFLGVGDG